MDYYQSWDLYDILVIFSVKMSYFIHLLFFGHISDILKIIFLKDVFQFLN